MIGPVIAGLAASLGLIAAHPAPAAHPAHPPIRTGTLNRGEAAIFRDLIRADFSRIQAAGIMASMEHESSFNVENHAMDTNGFRGYGLLSWNSEFYHGAHTLVTGNRELDLTNQIQFIKHDTDNERLGVQGRSAWAVGGNWSRYVEVCVNCEPGGKQFRERALLAQVIRRQADGAWHPVPTR